MKNKLLNLVAILLCSLIFVLPVQAADYGVVYDETEMLWSENLEELGTEVLPAFTETYGIDMRVDVLTGLGDFTDISEAAEVIYTEYGYGYGEGRNGVSLLVWVSGDVDGYAMEDWYVYCGGDSHELITNGPSNVVQEISAYLEADAWVGDMEADAQLLADAVDSMVRSMESFVLAGGVAETIWDPMEYGTSEGMGIAASEDWMKEEPKLDHVTDAAGLLSEEAWQELELKARDIAENHDFGVYIITVDDYREYADGDMHDACGALYKGYSLGLGQDKDGILLLLSMNDRDYRVYTYGEYGSYAFNQAGREMLVEFFLDDLSYDDWQGAFTDYLTWCEDYLIQAEAGTPYDENHAAMDSGSRMLKIVIYIGIILLVPLVIAGIVVLTLTSKMKSVAMAREAASYKVGDIQLVESVDQYTHTTETRQKVETEKSSSSTSSGGGSSTGGKF